MRRSTPDDIGRPFPEVPQERRSCHHADCTDPGEYRAPVSRDHLNQYYWFCLDHVRIYNKAWDYYAGMSEEQIERQRRWDTVWQRPSWPFGQFGERAGHEAGRRVRDDFDFFAENQADPRAPAGPGSDEVKALAVFDLKEPVTFADVKARYKALAKKLHPDANGGDRTAEERLKAVNQAYAALKISFA